MNYYHHHIGDFRSGTIHMSKLMRWIYRDMIEAYYDSEKPLPADIDDLYDLIGAHEEAEQKAVVRVLKLKFDLREDGYHHERCDVAIREYQESAEEDRERKENEAERQRRHRARRREIFRLLREDFDVVPDFNMAMKDLELMLSQHQQRGRQSRDESVTVGNSNATVTRDSSICTPDATAITNNQEPITNNQEPITKNKQSKDFSPPAAEGVADVSCSVEVQTVDIPAKIFEHWKHVMNHPRAKLDDKRRKKILGALKLKYTPDDLIQAINGCAKTPYNMGCDGRNTTVYDDIELILRDASHIDRFLRNNTFPVLPAISAGGAGAKGKFSPADFHARNNPQVIAHRQAEQGVIEHE